MKKLLLVLITISLTFIVSACKCGSCGQQEEATIPLEILKKADAFIIGQTGDVLFEGNFSPDFTNSKKLENGYYVVYNFRMKDKPFVDEKVSFTVDTLGNVKKDMEITGIPNCYISENHCMFEIDEAKAASIATEKGLQKGIKDWQTEFMWNGKHKRYVWHVLAVYSESEGSNGKRMKGEEVIIDPYDGNVIEMNKWSVN